VDGRNDRTAGRQPLAVEEMDKHLCGRCPVVWVQSGHRLQLGESSSLGSEGVEDNAVVRSR
jgi:hypothetical protein